MSLRGKGVKCIRVWILLEFFSLTRGLIGLKGLPLKASDELSTVPVDNLLNNFYWKLTGPIERHGAIRRLKFNHINSYLLISNLGEYNNVSY